MDEELFVVAESVEGIEDGEVFCFVSVESWRQDDAVGNAARKDFTGKGVAFDSAGAGNGSGDKKGQKEKQENQRTEGRGVGS